MCKCLQPEVKYVLYDDSMTTEERQSALAAFHADVPFLIMQTGISAVGLNLQIATTVILFESDFSSKGDIDTLDLVTRHCDHDMLRIVRLVTCSKVRRTYMCRSSKAEKNIRAKLKASYLIQKFAPFLDRSPHIRG